MSPCSRIKQLRKIVSDILEEDELSFNSYLYCNRQAAKSECYGPFNAKPLTCQSITAAKNCQKPLVIIAQGRHFGNRTKDGGSDWTEHIIPGGTICVVDDTLSGTCVTFKDRFTSTDKDILARGKRMPGPVDLPSPAKNKKEEGRVKRHRKNRYINPYDVILALAESVCKTSLTEQAVTLWKNGKVR